MVEFARRFALLIGLCLVQAQIVAATYVTEAKVSVDRCASAWFIKRFVDADAEFAFVAPNAERPNGITFGFFGAEYFNRASDCTYTALMKRHGKAGNEALWKINELANDAINWRFGRQFLGRQLLEHIADLRKVCASDADVFQKVFPTFDLLFLLQGGKSGDFLPTQRANADLIELVLLSQYLNDAESHRFNSTISALPDVSVESVFKAFDLHIPTAAQESEAPSFEALKETLSFQKKDLTDGSAKWLRSVSNPGLQTADFEQFIKWAEQHAVGQDARRMSLQFQIRAFAHLKNRGGR
jgi:hypothetical protein